MRQGQDQQALGRSRGGFSTKLHLRTDRQGRPITFRLTAGQRHEATQAQALVEQGAIKGTGAGRPRRRPRRICADKGYRSRAFRRYLMGRVIPAKRTERRRGPFDRAAYRERAKIEHCFNRLKQFRRIAPRYEKCACYYAAMVTIACIMLWL